MCRWLAIRAYERLVDDGAGACHGPRAGCGNRAGIPARRRRRKGHEEGRQEEVGRAPAKATT
jgi:hypothetical protein